VKAIWTGSPPPLAPGFIPRTEAGGTLEAALVPGATAALVSYHPGSAGRNWLDACGKTQLAVAFAQSAAEQAEVELVFWVTATSRASVLSGYAEAAAAAGIATTGDAESTSARLLRWLRDTSRPWLMILDDLTATAGLDARLWPAGPSGRVLVTTADAATVPGRPALVMPVGPFSHREALTYLMGRLTVDVGQRQGAIDLVGELGSEPLALAQASAVIASSELTCHDYREQFLRKRERLVGATSDELAAAALTWALAMDQAELFAQGTAHSLLVLAALLDGNGIPGTVLISAAAHEYCGYPVASGVLTTAQGVREGLAALEDAGLLAADVSGRPDVDRPAVGSTAPQLARLSWPVRAAVRAAMPEKMLRQAAVAAADAVLEAWPADADDLSDWLARALRSCTDSLQQAVGDLLWDRRCHPLLLRAGGSLDDARLTGAAVTYWEELAGQSARLLGTDHPQTFEINERLAKSYLAADQAAKAVSLLLPIRAELTRRLGRDHPGTIEATRDLGLALVQAGRSEQAIIVLAEAADGCERSQGTGSPAALAAREDLAAAYRGAGQLADAIALYRRVLADRERMRGSGHAATTATRQKLAEAYLAAGQAKAAISQYERMVADRERTLGPEHLHTVAARGALGSAYHAAGKMASAVRLAERTADEYTKILGADHRDTLTARLNVAHAYYGVGRRSDAVALLSGIIERSELNLPADDALTATARTSLANITGTI
jgi:tetratricopeptide (TPR) repeat protein